MKYRNSNQNACRGFASTLFKRSVIKEFLLILTLFFFVNESVLFMGQKSQNSLTHLIRLQMKYLDSIHNPNNRRIR